MPPKLKPAEPAHRRDHEARRLRDRRHPHPRVLQRLGHGPGRRRLRQRLGASRDPFRHHADELHRPRAGLDRRASAATSGSCGLHYIDPHGRYVAHPASASYGTSRGGPLRRRARLHRQAPRPPARRAGAPARRRRARSSSSPATTATASTSTASSTTARRCTASSCTCRSSSTCPTTRRARSPGAVSHARHLPDRGRAVRHRRRAARSFEGESLVPQIFYGQDARERVVFAETNCRTPLRAAVDRATTSSSTTSSPTSTSSTTWPTDPWEKTNLWPSEDRRGVATMKGYLDDWLERVFYARDPGQQPGDEQGRRPPAVRSAAAADEARGRVARRRRHRGARVRHRQAALRPGRPGRDLGLLQGRAPAKRRLPVPGRSLAQGR